MLLWEMVACVIKDRINRKMRLRMRQVKVLSEEPFNQIIMEHFRFVCSTKSVSSLNFYEGIHTDLVKKYHREQRSDVTEFIDKLNIATILFRVIELVGVKITAETQVELMENPETFELVDSDIEEVYTKVEHMNTVDYAEGMALSMMADTQEH